MSRSPNIGTVSCIGLQRFAPLNMHSSNQAVSTGRSLTGKRLCDEATHPLLQGAFTATVRETTTTEQSHKAR